MIISRVILKNWRNFQSVDVKLGDRVFLIGPNASGKSNFLDVFRFLRDIVKQGGGLQKAVKDRGGISKIRCFAARRDPIIKIEIHLSEASGKEPIWKYIIGIKQEVRGHRQPLLAYEQIWKGEKQLLNRPDSDDDKDKFLLTQTHLEQIITNRYFRDISNFFETVLYLHLIPQLIRHPESFSGSGIPGDPFGRSFLERLAQTSEKTRQSRLKKIEGALQLSVPQLQKITFIKDELGMPHLEANYDHWRAKGAKQREEQFSDGTLRLIGLLWSLLESDSLLLLEEPELSLNSGIVTKLPALMHRVQRKKKRQILLSTHSADLVSDRGVGGEEVLLLIPDAEGTIVRRASTVREIQVLLESGLSVAEAVLPHTVPAAMQQLSIFEL